MDKLIYCAQCLGATLPLWLVWMLFISRSERKKRNQEIEQSWHAKKREEEL